MACEPTVKIGKKGTFVRFQIACVDVEAVEDAWKKLGSCRNKNVANAANKIDVTTDDSTGDYDESIIGSKTKTFSLDGILKNVNGALENIADLYAHWNDASATGGQPTMWLEYTSPLGIETCPVVIESFDYSAPHNEPISWSITASVTASEIGVKFEPIKKKP